MIMMITIYYNITILYYADFYNGFLECASHSISCSRHFGNKKKTQLISSESVAPTNDYTDKILHLRPATNTWTTLLSM